MRIKTIILLSCVIFLVVLPFAALHYQAEAERDTDQENVAEQSTHVPTNAVRNAQSGRARVQPRDPTSAESSGGQQDSRSEERSGVSRNPRATGANRTGTQQGSKQDEMAEQPSIPIEAVMAVHNDRIQERIDRLTGLTLDETFVELLESQQYFYPGYYSERMAVPTDIQTLLSARTFLKVLQEFDALPHEEAIEKLYEFSETALGTYGMAVEMLLERERRKREGQTQEPLGSFTATNRMLCASLLLAARMGEHELLIRQLDEMQFHWHAYYDGITGYVQPEFVDMFEQARHRKLYGPLEDDAVLTIFMYAALDRSENSGNFGALEYATTLSYDGVTAAVIPLYPWDAPLTYYDFGMGSGHSGIDFNDAVELFFSYEFPSDFGDQKKKIVLQTLRERLSK